MIDESLRLRTSYHALLRITRSLTMSSTQSQVLEPSQQSQSETLPENYSYAHHIQWMDQQMPVSEFDREEVQNNAESCTQNSQLSGEEDRLQNIYNEFRHLFSDCEDGSSFSHREPSQESMNTQ